ncbi:O-acyltransferase like protein-like [Branchiostoma lanceolatum]|uniref:O-acyltransferase like protein-like n=1 Tax=Branchiostoma lanceolatum TaxID=7740 RepID=UPI00345724D5
MKLLLYISLCAAVVSLGRPQATWDQLVPEAIAQLNALAYILESQGLLQQSLVDTILNSSTVNRTDISIPTQPTGNISQQCQTDVAQYEEDLLQGKMYALRMLDAGGKPPSGILNGNLIWAGSSSQCLNVTRKGFNITFDGKFYVATLVPGGGGVANVSLRIGICVPSSCSQHDVIQRLDGSIYWRVLLQPGIVQVTSAYSHESPPIQNITIAAM